MRRWLKEIKRYEYIEYYMDNKILGYVPKEQSEIINDLIIYKKAWMGLSKFDSRELVCNLCIII